MAINVWRNRSPAPTGPDELLVLCAEARVLADVYGVMIVNREFTAVLVRDSIARTPDLQSHHAFIRAQGGAIGKIIRGE